MIQQSAIPWQPATDIGKDDIRGSDMLGTVDPQQRLESLYDAHAGGIHRWCRGMLGRREDADDAIQAIWLKLARQPRRLDRVANLSAYLWTIARNHVHSVLRRRALERLWTPSQEEHAEDGLVPDPSSDISEEERRDVLVAVSKLKPRFRSVVLLVAFEGCTLEETGERLGIPRGTAASRYHSALQKLQNFLV